MGKITWRGAAQLAPVPAVLIASNDGVRQNVFTVAWTGIVCSTPPMISISIRPERFSYGMIEKSGEFTVNLPTESLAEQVDMCGVVSGKEFDKFALCGLTAQAGETVRAPIIEECPLNLECRVKQQLPLGSHVLFLAEITAVRVEERLIGANGRLQLETADLLAYVHGHYHKIGDAIGHFGYSVRRKKGSVVRV